MFNFTRLEYFIKAAHCLNFTEAAKLLYITQPALCRQIALFENDVGMKLFDRDKRQLRLTRAGAELLPELERLHEELCCLNSRFNLALNKVRNNVAGKATINLGIVTLVFRGDTFNQGLLRFISCYPEVVLNLESLEHEVLTERLMDGSLDIAVMMSFEQGVSPELNTLRLEKRYGYIAVSSDHWLAGLDSVSFKDVKDETFILKENKTEFSHHILDDCRIHSFEPQLKRVSNAENILDYVELGKGIAIFDKSFGTAHPRNIKYIYCPDIAPYYLICAWKKDNRNPSIKAFISCLHLPDNVTDNTPPV